MVAVFMAGFWVGRLYNWPNVLAVAALTITVCTPPALLSVSFQLSFTAVWAILLGINAVPELSRLGDMPSWRRWVIEGGCALMGLTAGHGRNPAPGHALFQPCGLDGTALQPLRRSPDRHSRAASRSVRGTVCTGESRWRGDVVAGCRLGAARRALVSCRGSQGSRRWLLLQ